jgi:hypothetical protein
MERRTALKNMAVAVGGLISLPSWANGWNKASVQSFKTSLTFSENAILAEVVETIIPKTNTPGAKELGVHQFVQKMVADCYEPSAQENLTKGVAATEEIAQKTFSKPFVECSAEQRTELLNQMSKSSDASAKGFFSLVKGLTIRGYMNSEYVMTNITKYELIPGRFHGCVPVPSKTISQKPTK